MRKLLLSAVLLLLVVSSAPLFGQNCFLDDFAPRAAVIPLYNDAEKSIEAPTVFITLNADDTLRQVSKYIFGNAVAVWVGQMGNEPVLTEHLQTLAPTLIRFPGGSWSDIFFWNAQSVGNIKGCPDSLIDGTTGTGKKDKFYPAFGKGSWSMTVDNYYKMRENVDTEGLITVNYGYARYGTSKKPAEEAAHLAAEWVRYDDGRTKFWEIGNESGGPWEAGWQIDTSKNQDGQPEVITGELYGTHVKIFADSMRKAADEVGAKICIGAQILHYDGKTSWNIADRAWNPGYFKAAGNTADFYVVHNYFGSNPGTAAMFLSNSSTIKTMMTYIEKSFAENGIVPKPVALTEWNMSGHDAAKTSVINGMQAVLIFCEMIQQNYGMSCRWLVANWEADGMFYKGDNKDIPAWYPRPDFFYTYYLRKYVGDYLVGSSVQGEKNLLAYSTLFGSGHVGLVVVNKSTTDHVVDVATGNYGVGERYYLYSLIGGDDDVNFSQQVFVNGFGPSLTHGGPIDDLDAIPAFAYPIGNKILFNSPARSVQYVMIEQGNTIVSVNDENNSNNRFGRGEPEPPTGFELSQNYPNPFNSVTNICFDLPTAGQINFTIFDISGHVVRNLANGELSAGSHSIFWDGRNGQGDEVSSGIYFYQMNVCGSTMVKKMSLLK